MNALLETYCPFLPLFSFLLTSLAVIWIHPLLVRLARLKNIVDNPDARKLQRTPVPVLGGVAVFFGITLSMGSFCSCYDSSLLPIFFTVLTVMLYIGTMDDVMGLSPRLRFVIEILSVLLLIIVSGSSIDHFHGLWQIKDIPEVLAVPLTVFIAVGIINSINLIDGVNGLSSGFCILASAVFGLFFYLSDDVLMTILASACCGAILPFFLHNVFGNTSRMFIGDGGTLLMGMVMSIFVIRVLEHDSKTYALVDADMGLIPFTMAVLSIPVFDTLRVMTTRILRGKSPFQPDKTHLHHLFIEVGFSHSGTAFCILLLNALVVLLWWASWQLGVGIDFQLYLVIGLGVLLTFVFYPLVKHLDKQNSFYRWLRYLALHSYIEKKGTILRFQRWLDKI